MTALFAWTSSEPGRRRGRHHVDHADPLNVVGFYRATCPAAASGPAHSGTPLPAAEGQPGELTPGSEPAAAPTAEFAIIRIARTLFLRGELDFSTIYLLAQAGADLIAHCVADSVPSQDEHTPTEVVLDTAGLRFIDAGGLGALITLRNALAATGVSLHTIHASRQLRRVSGICQLDATLGLDPPEQHVTARPSSVRRRIHRAPIPSQTLPQQAGPQPAGRTA